MELILAIKPGELWLIWRASFLQGLFIRDSGLQPRDGLGKTFEVVELDDTLSQKRGKDSVGLAVPSMCAARMAVSDSNCVTGGCYPSHELTSTVQTRVNAIPTKTLKSVREDRPHLRRVHNWQSKSIKGGVNHSKSIIIKSKSSFFFNVQSSDKTINEKKEKFLLATLEERSVNTIAKVETYSSPGMHFFV
ncbi:hypothetical protein E6O75_ATG03899 [Venturia nashicola]|uniref:Uncharacterized protein n=1 Tax=Venturia nashicola TaxID=86259 RepID=A0A4Z1PK66_9PEZI|nr:hypothetical protein E6O75_ATG03899 [Venturia nashicola]